jgi:hypothetical protein
MKTLVAFACALCACASITGRAAAPTSAPTPATAVIDRFLSSGKPGLTSFKARRVLTASTLGGRMRASLEAWTFLDANGTFRFDVVAEEGSALVRERVLVAALETEQRSRNGRGAGQAELTPANYEFALDRATGDGLVVIRLVPRRRTPMLLDGTVTVRQLDGDVVRIDGSPSESPSWWTRHVDITRRYARIAGVRVPVEMSSRADVRVAGDATFSMKYDYMMINGQTKW